MKGSDLRSQQECRRYWKARGTEKHRFLDALSSDWNARDSVMGGWEEWHVVLSTREGVEKGLTQENGKGRGSGM